MFFVWFSGHNMQCSGIISALHLDITPDRLRRLSCILGIQLGSSVYKVNALPSEPIWVFFVYCFRNVLMYNYPITIPAVVYIKIYIPVCFIYIYVDLPNTAQGFRDNF